MNIFEMIILDLILLLFPLMFYLIYAAYSKTLDIKKNNLYLDVALFSSIYFLLRIGNLDIKGMPIILLDILLIISYLKKRKFTTLVISIFLILYYNEIYNISILIFIFEYFIYLLIYRLCFNKNKFVFTNLCISFKIIMFVICIYLSNLYSFSYLLFQNILLFIIITNFVIYLYNCIDDMFSLYKQVEKISKESEIRQSLFKITHEIKNPIAVCKGYLDMFDVNNVEHSKKYIPIIKSEISRVLALLQDFLSITKIKIEKDEMDINMLLEDTIYCLKPLFNSKSVKVISNISDDEIYMNGDYNRLKQALINIFKNSLESIKDNGTIKLDTKISKNKMKITIEDNGKGMSEEELNQIKEAFFTTKNNGTGLGVYLSNEIIKLHNGKLEYESKKYKGTKVTITLPI